MQIQNPDCPSGYVRPVRVGRVTDRTLPGCGNVRHRGCLREVRNKRRMRRSGPEKASVMENESRMNK